MYYMNDMYSDTFSVLGDWCFSCRLQCWAALQHVDCWTALLHTDTVCDKQLGYDENQSVSSVVAPSGGQWATSKEGRATSYSGHDL